MFFRASVLLGVVRHSQVRPSGNHDSPQGLIADESQKCRIVDLIFQLALAFFARAVKPMASSAGSFKQKPSLGGVAAFLVRR